MAPETVERVDPEWHGLRVIAAAYADVRREFKAIRVRRRSRQPTPLHFRYGSIAALRGIDPGITASGCIQVGRGWAAGLGPGEGCGIELKKLIRDSLRPPHAIDLRIALTGSQPNAAVMRRPDGPDFDWIVGVEQPLCAVGELHGDHVRQISGAFMFAVLTDKPRR